MRTLSTVRAALLLGALALAAPAQAQTTYYISPTGSDAASGLSDALAWATLGHAVGPASPVGPGDTVVLRPGLYAEPSVVTTKSGASGAPITLSAEGATLRYAGPQYDRAGVNFGNGIFVADSVAHWTIRGLRVEGLAPGDTRRASVWGGIVLRDARHVLVENVHTFRTGGSGVIVYYGGPYGAPFEGEGEVTSRDVRLIGSTIEKACEARDEQEAVSFWGVDGFEIAYNTVVEGQREGIDVKVGTRNGSIHHNRISRQALFTGTAASYRGGPALYVDGNRASVFNVDVYANVVFDNEADGIVVADEVPLMGGVWDVRVFNNLVYDNGRVGVNGGKGLSAGSSVRDVAFYHNTVVRNVFNVYVYTPFYDGVGYEPSGLVFRNNVFARARYATGLVESGQVGTFDANLFTTGAGDQAFFGGGSMVETGTVFVDSVGFVDAGADDFRLTLGSSAVDTGAPLPPGLPGLLAAGLDGTPRPTGAAPDRGAYEFAAPDAPDAGLWYSLTHVPTGRALDSGSGGSVDADLGCCSGGQGWRLVAGEDSGVYLVVNRKSERGALDTSPGGAVTWKTDPAPEGLDKRWRLTPAGEGRFWIENQKPGRGLLTADASGQVSWQVSSDRTPGTLWRLTPLGPIGDAALLAATEPAPSDEQPGATAAIESLRPNPAGAEARLAFRLADRAPYRVTVYDALGREALRPTEGWFAGEPVTVRLDVASLPTGLYLVRVESKESVLSRTLTVVR